MKSIRMDFVRDGDDSAIFEKGRTYHVVIESSQHRQFKMPLMERDFRRFMAELRYHKSITERKRKSALKKLSSVATKILKPPEDSTDTLQLDLVTSARELCALPFEAALASNGEPLLARKEPAVVLTRRAPKAFAERQLQWPARPRVLFAYASPEWAGGHPVDDSAHQKALLDALHPWIEPQKEDAVLTICKEASLEDIEQACRKADDEGKPYTHVHLLAHGVKLVEEAYEDFASFGIALRSDDDMPTMPKDLVRVLWPERAPDWQGQELPVVVTLAICDAANAVNTITEAGGLAQELHIAGVPIVVASQLPLTFPGSEIMTRVFYGGWMAGKDVRTVLHKTRVALHEDEGSGHDWVSLVAYVRLPEGYNDYLLDIRLQSQLAALETASNYAKQLLEKNIKDDLQYDEVTNRLQERIKQLEQFLEEYTAITDNRRRDVIQENTGLLGSAYKRLAELYAIRALADQPRLEHWLAESRLAMEKAREWYHQGFRRDPADHWTGVQYLVLEAILNGRVSKIADWYACYVAATTQRDYPEGKETDKIKKQIWALGSIAELGLIAPLAQGAVFPAEDATALTTLCQLVKAHSQLFGDFSPVYSTRRQLMRYVDWWTKTKGFFKDQESDLEAEARKLLKLLED